MISEWMKVMLEEIARKKNEAEQARREEKARAEDNRATQSAEPRSGDDRARG